MKFKISEKMFEKYPELGIGIIIVKNANNTKSSQEVFDLLKEEENKWKEKSIDASTIKEIPVIAKWREIYENFGAKPRDYRNSAEAVLKSALTRGLPNINPLVDLYNFISLKYTLTVGGEDINKIQGDLILDFANGNEEFIPLGTDKNNSPWKGEVVYKDGKGVICRCWNWREGDRTKLTEDTKDAVIVIENIIPTEKEKTNEALVFYFLVIAPLYQGFFLQ